MAGIKDSGQAHAGLKALHHDPVHFVIHDVADHTKVDGINDFIIAVFFVTVKIGCLAAMAGVVEEQGIVRLGIFDKPMHGTENVLFGGLAHRVLLVVGQNNHIFSRVAKIAVQVSGHILDIVNAAAELAFLVEVVYANEESLATASTSGILKGVG